MSALGQKQTWHSEIVMSASPPKADIAERDGMSVDRLSDNIFSIGSPLTSRTSARCTTQTYQGWSGSS
jgi:hypothetical protein